MNESTSAKKSDFMYCDNSEIISGKNKIIRTYKMLYEKYESLCYTLRKVIKC